jgi:tetratricopeptide (TPR) repeat protein
MDAFFQKLNTVSSKKDLVEEIETGRKKLGEIKGTKKLEFAWRLLKWAGQYHSRKFAEEIINDVLELAKETSTEEAALLLGQKAYCNFANFNIPEATHYADLALKKSRDIRSNKAEAKALTVKGYLCDIKKEHKKTSAWYTIALAKCTKLQQPGLVLDLGTSLSKQGEYSQAWSWINEAKSLANDLSDERSLEDVERKNLKRIVAESYSRLGPVYEGIGDFDAALRAYDNGLALSLQHSFTNETYKIYSRKTKTYIMLESFSEAEAALKKADAVLQKSRDADPRSFLYLAHDWACLYKESKQHEQALTKYKQILFVDTIDAPQTWFKRLHDFMDNQADIFSEIVKGIAECLYATGRITEAETINRGEALFSELKQQTGIYEEKDRKSKLRNQKNSLGATLRQVFFNDPDFVEYKNIQAQYDPEEGKATFIIGEEKIKKKRRYFLVFKYLVDNAGKHVTGKMLDGFVSSQGYVLTEGNSGLRGIVKKLKKEVNLAQFFEPLSPSERSGWKLKTP